MLQCIGLQKVRHDLLTEQQQQQIVNYIMVAGFKITYKINFFSIYLAMNNCNLKLKIDNIYQQSISCLRWRYQNDIQEGLGAGDFESYQ